MTGQWGVNRAKRPTFGRSERVFPCDFSEEPAAAEIPKQARNKEMAAARAAPKMKAQDNVEGLGLGCEVGAAGPEVVVDRVDKHGASLP